MDGWTPRIYKGFRHFFGWTSGWTVQEKGWTYELEMIKMSNKATGSQFEKRFAAILSHNRFWVHIFQDNCNGQPCDVMAARDGETYLFDCKNCEKERFLLSRMEENQLNAMELFYMTGNKRGMFVIQFPADQSIWLIILC